MRKYQNYRVLRRFIIYALALLSAAIILFNTPSPPLDQVHRKPLTAQPPAPGSPDAGGSILKNSRPLNPAHPEIKYYYSDWEAQGSGRQEIIQEKIIIDKCSNTLYLYKEGKLIKTYRVATGKIEGYTPEGQFKIVNKSPYPRGEDPDSLLGSRWMGLEVPCQKDNRAAMDPRAPRGVKYGIHGTNEPESIGTFASGGCIRMNNEEVAELYSLVPIGTEVEIIK